VPLFNVEKAKGRAKYKMYSAYVSAKHGDTVDTGLKSIIAAKLTPVNTAPRDCHPTSITGGVITIGLWNGDPTLTAVTTITTAETIHVEASGVVD